MEIDVAAELQRKGYVLKDGVLTIPSYPVYVVCDTTITEDMLKQPSISLIGTLKEDSILDFPVSNYPGMRTIMVNNRLIMNGFRLILKCKNDIDCSSLGPVFWLKRLIGYIEIAKVDDVQAAVGR